jgi:hypothetical protein
MHQAHDGVAIIVPVSDQPAPAKAAHKPADSNARQARGVLQERNGEAGEAAQTVGHNNLSEELQHTGQRQLPWQHPFWFLF